MNKNEMEDINMEKIINLVVNGNVLNYNLIEDEEKLLLDFLRDDLHLTGTKRGCDEKACGACTVLVDGVATRSCHAKMKDMDQKTVVTIEGLSKDGELDNVQQALIDHSAVQCGFCTPGLVMGIHGLLNKNSNPTPDEIKKGLRLHLCRCGTYPRIIAAVQQAAAKNRGDKVKEYTPLSLSDEGKYIGKSILRKDYKSKVEGTTKFFADYHFPDMLYGQAVYSPHPYAEILSIDTSLAYDVPGVELVITHEDIPGDKYFGAGARDQQVLCQKYVKHMGDMVAVVFANSVKVAESAAKLVKVEYKKLNGVFTIEDALKPDAPIIPDPNGPVSALSGLYLRGEKGNICREVALKRGDIEDAFLKSDVVVEADFSTPREEHAWIEVDGAVSAYDENNCLTIYAPNQDPFGDHEQLVDVLGLKPEEVRVVHTPCGGAFGGKLELTTHALVAIATMKTGRAAKMSLRRKDSIRSHSKRHPFKMTYKIGLQKDGKILGLQTRCFADGGPYLSWSHRIIEQGLSWGSGPYFIPVLDSEGKVVYTNNPVCGAMRGFGANQTHFAMEAILDMAAKKLNIDPITIRDINGLEHDKLMTTGQTLTKDQGINYKETLKMIREVVEEKLIPMKKEGEYIGIGIASGWRSIGGGMGNPDVTGAALELLEDGKVSFRISCVEMGQGSITSLAQIASETTGIAMEDYDIIAGDTSKVPYGGHVSASRGVFLWGHPTMLVGKQFKELLLQRSAALLKLEKRDIDIEESKIILQKTGECVMTLKELAERVGERLLVQDNYTMPDTTPVRSDTNEKGVMDQKDYKTHYTASYTTAAAVVKVNPETGDVKVLHITSITDAGKIINPEAAATQIEGCIVMGTAYALTNNFKVEEGVIITDTLGKCKVPRINNMPDSMEVLFADQPDPSGPYGAKGLAEIGVLTVAPAICNAIYDAVGVRIQHLPVNDHLKEIKK